MAEPRPWQILQTVQARLQEIHTPEYHTDVGEFVRLEESEQWPDGTIGLTVYTLANERPENVRVAGEREFTGLIEAAWPANYTNAHHVRHLVAEDIERALDNYLQQPLALPIKVGDIVFLDRPDGLPVIAVQIEFWTRYRR